MHDYKSASSEQEQGKGPEESGYAWSIEEQQKRSGDDETSGKVHVVIHTCGLKTLLLEVIGKRDLLFN